MYLLIGLIRYENSVGENEFEIIKELDQENFGNNGGGLSIYLDYGEKCFSWMFKMTEEVETILHQHWKWGSQCPFLKN